MTQKAPGLLRGASLEHYLHQWPAWCARSLLEKTRAECPGSFPDDAEGPPDFPRDPGGDVCPWQLDSAGGLSRKAPPPDPMGPKALGLTGAEVARATSPDGSRTLVATAVARPRPDDAPSWELRFAEVEVASRKVLRVLHAVREQMNMTSVATPVLFVDTTLPDGMAFLGPDRAVLATSPPQVVDLAAGAILEVDGDTLGSRWAVASARDALIDLATMKRFALDPDAAAFRAVKSYGAQCPSRLEDTKE